MDSGEPAPFSQGTGTEIENYISEDKKVFDDIMKRGGNDPDGKFILPE